MSPMALWNDLKDWLMTLSPEFLFLLMLPFAVALAAFLKGWLAGPGRPGGAGDADRERRVVSGAARRRSLT